MDISEWTAYRIKTLAKQKNITINKLATLSGLTQSTVDSIINGKSKNPRLNTIKKICEGLNISIIDFFNDPLFDEIED